MEQDREEIEFCEEWLTLKKYYFKILTMVTVLADNQKAFRGKLKDLCDSLDIQSSSAKSDANRSFPAVFILFSVLL